MALSPPIVPSAPPERRRRASNPRRGSASVIPPELQIRIHSFAVELIEHHGDAFSDPEMKNRIAGLLRRGLPPRSRRPGRPGFAIVSAAIGLHAELKRSSPESSPKEIWKEIYRRLIPKWDDLSRIERRTEAEELRRRVRWRVYARRRKHWKPRTGKFTT